MIKRGYLHEKNLSVCAFCRILRDFLESSGFRLHGMDHRRRVPFFGIQRRMSPRRHRTHGRHVHQSQEEINEGDNGISCGNGALYGGRRLFLAGGQIGVLKAAQEKDQPVS